MKPADPTDLPRDDSGAVEQTVQPQAAAVEPPAATAERQAEQLASPKAYTREEARARLMARLPGRFVPGPGETAHAEQGPQSVWPGLESAQKLAKLLFCEPDVVVELRALRSKGRAGNVSSGYFDAPLEFLRAAARCDGDFDGLYATLNRVNPDLLARAANRVQDRADATTSDIDILERRLFLVDVDPVRPSGISSTDDEHAHAIEVADAIAAELTELGWPAPVCADSGNGAHLLYRLGADCDDKDLLERCIKAVAMQFDSEQSIVDPSVTKRAQLTKLYGSMVRKGDSTEKRPHRRSALRDVPDEIVPVTREQLEALAGRLPADRDPAPRHAPATSKGHQLDVPGMLASAGLEVRRYGPWDGKERWVLETCPWNPSHGPGKAWVARFSGGALAAGCLHSGCAGRGWADLKSRFYPSAKASSASASAVDPVDPTTATANVGAAAAIFSAPGEARSSAAADASALCVASQHEAQAGVRKPGEFRVGDLVSPNDRDNQGQVTSVDGAKVWVHFVNPETGNAADRCFVPAQLKLLREAAVPARIVVLSTQDVLNFVPPPWLIEGVLKQGELAVMFGAPGAGKSLVALDMALCITQGRAWNGQATASGPVLYIAAEGQGGLKLRMLAWNEGELPDVGAASWNQFFVIAESVQLTGDDLAALIHAVGEKAEGAKLVIVDTLARTAVGLEENSAKDMGRYIHAADQLRKQTKAAVMIVHHAAKIRDDAPAAIRGSSALTAAVDTQIAVTKGQNDFVTVTCEKQKDAADFAPMLMRKESIDLSEVLQTQGATGGRVVFVGEAIVQRGKREKRGKQGAAQPGHAEQAILETFENSFPGKWVSRSMLMPATSVPKSTFHKALQRLVERSLVDERQIGNRFEYRPKHESLSSQSPAVSPSLSGSAAPLDPPVSRLSSPVGGETERRNRGMGDDSAESEARQ